MLYLGIESEADALLFLSDVPGVRGGDGQLLGTLTHSECERLRKAGVLKSGMLPKVAAALEALGATGQLTVKIAAAAGDNAVLEALGAAAGTSFEREEAGRG